MATEPVLPDLMRLQELLRTTLDRAARDAGLGTAEYVVLRALARTPGLTGAELAREARVTPQSMHGVLVRLQGAGRIEQGPHRTDKRLRVFTLTESGRAAALADAERAGEVEDRLTSGLSRARHERLSRALRACVVALEGLGQAEPSVGSRVPDSGTNLKRS